MIGPGVVQGDSYWRRCRMRRSESGDLPWDGDTLYVDVDLGCDVGFRPKLRLSGVNAPELHAAGGLAARDYSDTWLSEHEQHVAPARVAGRASSTWPFLLHYDGWDNYGERIDGVLLCGLGHCLNDDGLADGIFAPRARTIAA